MNTVSAQEVKRRGVIALQEAARHGSVHIVKNNRPVGVFLSESDYAALNRHKQKEAIKESLLDWMISKPATGNQSANTIAAQLKDEREAWD